MTRPTFLFICAIAAALSLAAPTSATSNGHGFVSRKPVVLAGPHTTTPTPVYGADFAGGAVFLVPASAPASVIAHVESSVTAAASSIVDGRKVPRFAVSAIQSNNAEESTRNTYTVVDFVGLPVGSYIAVGFTKEQVDAETNRGFTMTSAVTAVQSKPSTSPILAPVISFFYSISGTASLDQVAFKPPSSKGTSTAECVDFCGSLTSNRSRFDASVQTVSQDGQVYASYNTGAVGDVGPRQIDCVCYRKSMASILANKNSFDYTPTPQFSPLDLGIAGPLITNDPPIVLSGGTAEDGLNVVRDGQDVTVYFQTKQSENIDAASYTVSLVSVAPYSQYVNGLFPCMVSDATPFNLTCKVSLEAESAAVSGVWNVVVSTDQTSGSIPLMTREGKSLGGKVFVIIELPTPVVTSVSGECAIKSSNCRPERGNLKVSFTRGKSVQEWAVFMFLRFTPINHNDTGVMCYETISTPGSFECNLRRKNQLSTTWRGVYNVDLVTQVSDSPNVEQVVRLDGTLALGYGDAVGFGPQSRFDGRKKSSKYEASVGTVMIAVVMSGVALVVALVVMVVALVRRHQMAVAAEGDGKVDIQYVAAKA